MYVNTHFLRYKLLFICAHFIVQAGFMSRRVSYLADQNLTLSDWTQHQTKHHNHDDPIGDQDIKTQAWTCIKLFWVLESLSLIAVH